MEQTGASINKAKEWIGGVFARVESSFRERRTQSMQRRSEMASFYNRQGQWGKNTEQDMSILEQTFFNRLKSYCLSALQGNTGDECNGRQIASNLKEEIRQDRNANLEAKDLQETKTARSVRCNMSVSITSIEKSMLDSYYSSTTRRGMQTEITQRTTCEKRKAYGSRKISLQKDSTDSDVFTELEDEQLLFVDEQCSTSTYFELRESGERTEQDEASRECNVTRNASNNGYKEASERIEAEETFSKNYSAFCEKLSSIQKRPSISHDHTNMEMHRSASYHPLIDPLTKTKVTSNLHDSLTPDGQITISLQHFQKSRQLRIVLHSVESSVEHNRKMFCKVTLTAKKSRQKEKSRKIRSKNGNADIKETFYMNAGEDLNGYILKIQLRTMSRILKRQSKACTAYIALGTIDIDLDTTMVVKLRDSKSLKQVGNNENVYIISENRSIHAEVTAMLHGTTQISNSNLKRHLSLPQIRYDNITLRPQRAMTLNSKVRN